MRGVLVPLGICTTAALCPAAMRMQSFDPLLGELPSLVLGTRASQGLFGKCTALSLREWPMHFRALLLQEGGVLATHRHESLLGGSRVERLLSHAAEQRATAQDMAARGAAAAAQVRAAMRDSQTASDSSGPALSIVTLLASWKGVSAVQMAHELLDMTAEQRTSLRQQYAGQLAVEGAA